MPRIDDKVAIITGASSGIGKATAQAFSNAGAKIVLAARSESGLNQTAETLAGDSLVVPTDVLQESGCQELIDKTLEKYSSIDILVNAAGIIKMGTIETTTVEDWDVMFNINVRSVFYLIHIAVPHLKKTRGSIVNVSSVTGIRSFPGVLAYNCSKSALDQLTRCTSLELAADGVRVNSVNPGVIRTELHRRGGMEEDRYKKFIEHSAQNTHPLGRVGQPEEVADLILYLASDKAGFITGINCAIDGGRANTCLR
jgi:NAD(P)-dependent dehydrogenase (short-subunit alcohol dehydrogenase family)